MVYKNLIPRQQVNSFTSPIPCRSPRGQGRIWLASEAAAMRDIRKHFLLDLGVDRTLVNTQGYWKYGAANHSDHDWGTEI